MKAYIAAVKGEPLQRKTSTTTYACFLSIELTSCFVTIAGMQQASMNLTESLHEVYEPDWHGKDDVMTIGKVHRIKATVYPFIVNMIE